MAIKLACRIANAHESTTLALYGGLVTHGLLSAAMDGQLKLWRLHDDSDQIDGHVSATLETTLTPIEGSERALSKAHPLAILTLALSTDRTHLLTASLECSGLELWDVCLPSVMDASSMASLLRHRVRIPLPSHECWAVAFLPASQPNQLRFLTTGHSAHQLFVYETSDISNPNLDVHKLKTVEAPEGLKYINKLLLSPNGRFVVALTKAGAVLVIDAVSLEILHCFKDSIENLRAAVFSEDSTRLFVAGEDSRILVYDLVSMSMHTCIYGISPCVLSLALAPSQSAVPLLAVGMANKRVKVFQLTQDSGHPFQATAIFESSEHHTSMIWDLSFSCDGRYLFVAGAENDILCYAV